MLRLFRATPPTRTPVGYSSSFESQPNIRVAGTSRARPDPDSNKATETTSAAPLNNYQAHPQPLPGLHIHRMPPTSRKMRPRPPPPILSRRQNHLPQPRTTLQTPPHLQNQNQLETHQKPQRKPHLDQPTRPHLPNQSAALTASRCAGTTLAPTKDLRSSRNGNSSTLVDFTQRACRIRKLPPCLSTRFDRLCRGGSGEECRRSRCCADACRARVSRGPNR